MSLNLAEIAQRIQETIYLKGAIKKKISFDYWIRNLIINC